MTIQIENLTVSKEMNKSDMSAVRGGVDMCQNYSDGTATCWPLDVYLKNAAKEGGAYGLIDAASKV
jgi:hypothetical protein